MVAIVPQEARTVGSVSPIESNREGLNPSVLPYSEMQRLTRELIANHGYYLREGAPLQRQIRATLLASSFAHHHANNGFYRKLCEEQKVGLESVLQDVSRIPVIPVNLFKDQKYASALLTKGLAEIEFELRSTGTSGVPSVSRRDKDTVDTLSLGFAALYREYFSISNGCGLFLCPSPAEFPEMGMVKALNYLSGMLDDRVYLVRRYSFSSRDAIATLEQWKDRFVRHIVGPPFMINRLLQFMKKNDLKLPLERTSKIIMLGGWKRFNGEQISRDQMANLCRDHLGMEHHQIRDMYGLVECNMLAIECEHGRKHVPPWVHIHLQSLQDPTKPAGPREAGVACILDPTSTAYPCFLQTEDVALVGEEAPCPCGRSSQTIRFLRRVAGAELGCCAINLERFVTDGDIVRDCKL